jgi:hypothetical protein
MESRKPMKCVKALIGSLNLDICATFLILFHEAIGFNCLSQKAKPV